MNRVENIYLDKLADGHYDLVLIRESGEKIVLACYEDRPLLLKEFKTDEKESAGVE